jgi:uncharacterized membrane protein YecN with MAPEG domain
MAITAFYASILTALFILLSVRVIAQRQEARVEIGHGESPQLLRRMRVHANFAEYVPLALVLMALSESLKVPSLFLHLLGLTLVGARIVHAYGLSQTPHILRWRRLGMMLTFGVLGVLALFCFLYGGVQLIV